MRLIQYRAADGRPSVGVVTPDGEQVRRVAGAESTYQLALASIGQGLTLEALVAPKLEAGEPYRALLEAGRLLPPLTHPDPARCLVSGTGLTHLGSAATRDAMHHKVAGDEDALSDSMRMFKWGLEGGRPAPGVPGVQPEWFYKGNGTQAVAAGQPLTSPSFALDGGEEPEMAGIYVISKDGAPFRVGFAVSNEFSDHVMERINYLYLAHSKLRQASFGPEIRVGAPPEDIRGTSRIRRAGEVIFEKPFLSGEANMSHTFANLEYHHFKYDLFRQPGDVHVHMFGTATLSFADGIKPQAGDVFEIEVPEFGLPLRNPLRIAAEEAITVGML